MEKRDYYPILESILFTMGKSVEIKTLAEALKLTQEEIKQILQDMAKEYSEKQRGIQLVFLEDSVQLCTKPQYYEYLIRIASRPQKQVLSDSVLETLSIVALSLPAHRSLTTSPAIISPATDGTNATLPGMSLRSVHLCFAPGGQIQFVRQLMYISSIGLVGFSSE